MKTLKFKKIDAFTKGISSGNPAGYIYMNHNKELDEVDMQKIATELKGFVNEVGYVNKTDEQFNLRFFSSECEVTFCGHATIAIMYDLIKNNQELLTKNEVLINVSTGTLSVFNHIKEDDAVYIMAPEPKFLTCTLQSNNVADILGIHLSDINKEMPIKLVDGGLRTLIVPIVSLENCLKINPNQENLKMFCLDNEIDIIHVSTKETNTTSSKYRTRVFAPKYGYLEDPATGSGNASFGYYLINENLWNDNFTVEQGSDKNNPNFIKLKRYKKDGMDRIIFGGCGTTRIEGDYCFHG
ncbi:PhzF family phenazine biosynthesis protein [Clostridiaceae bacterium M8S5]|nr:PhzF family phenazine biosynthesis protein [Clostridiaceae bacterium M8S5]